MPPSSVLIEWRREIALDTWQPTTPAALGKTEGFLEQIVSERPALLQLESRRSGIRGPLRVFRQVGYSTPMGRPIIADIVLLAASGHVIVVEVKRYGNPELRDRAVIAQIIDYASSFSSLTADRLCELFSTPNHHALAWPELVLRLFPDEPDGEDLAELLLSRFRSGELNLVPVCDRVPAGLPELIAGIATQKTVGFDLDLVEITPYSRSGEGDSIILFVPATRLATEVVARAAITITYRQGDPRPETSVQTTSLNEIEERVRKAKKSADAGRVWTAAEIEEEARRLGEPIAVELIQFCKRYSDQGEFFAPGRRVNANFGLYLQGRKDDGTVCRRCVFNCTPAWKCVYLYLNFVTELVGRELAQHFNERLAQVFGEHFNAEAKEIGIPLSVVAKHWPTFQDVLLWVRSQAASRAVHRQMRPSP